MAAGCGYSMQPLHRTNVKTVSRVDLRLQGVPARTGVRPDGQTGVKLIDTQTPYKVVQDPKRADTELRGEITALDAPVLTENIQDQHAAGHQVTVTCWFEWKDLRTGEILARREKISGLELRMRRRSARTWIRPPMMPMMRLAEHIVEAMESDW